MKPPHLITETPPKKDEQINPPVEVTTDDYAPDPHNGDQRKSGINEGGATRAFPLSSDEYDPDDVVVVD